jgi:hypothetical protein
MHIGRKLLILAIVLLFSYIIYSLLQKRREIKSSLQNYYKEKEKQKHLEGFGEKDDPNYDAIMKDIKNISTKITYQIDNNNKPIVYKNYNTTTIDNKTLKDVFMKASYNSAFTGNYLSSEMVKFCLSQGCRFLDFEVDISNSKPYVFCKNNSDKTDKTKSGKPEAISLLEVLKCTLNAAFNENSGSSYPITNINDPVFIHIRCNNTNYDSVYNDVLKKLINDTYYNKYLNYSGANFINVYPNSDNLSSYKDKAIIIFCSTDDSSISNSTYSNYKYNKSNAKTYTNITPTTPANSNKDFQIVVSDETALDEIKPNPDVFTSINDYGYQVTCISYSNYLKEAYLTQNERKYENMFIDFNYSYMLMSELKTYITSNPLYIKV